MHGATIKIMLAKVTVVKIASYGTSVCGAVAEYIGRSLLVCVCVCVSMFGSRLRDC
jgi:hypothetical protein